MVKFGRKFFFDRVHTKRNYTLPIIIAAVIIVAIIATFLITSFFKEDKTEEKTPKIVLNKSLEIEINSELPNISEYIKNLENIKEEDLEISYPENLVIIEENRACENTLDTVCKKQIVTAIGEYEVTIKSEKLKDASTATLKVVDKTAPVLTLKEVSITEGNTYKIEDFIESCSDNSNTACSYEYSNDKNDNDEIIDYSKYTEVGEYIIRIIAKDRSNNQTEKIETKLIITKKPNNNSDKEQTCKYGNLKHSSAYVIATRITDNKCAISAEQANDLSYKPGIEHNKKLVKEIQSAYLKNTIDKLNLGGELTYDITYGPVFNSTNKGVVGYYLLSEAKQTINGKTTTIARYFIDENGNRVWKINALNLK